MHDLFVRFGTVLTKFGTSLTRFGTVLIWYSIDQYSIDPIVRFGQYCTGLIPQQVHDNTSSCAELAISPFDNPNQIYS